MDPEDDQDELSVEEQAARDQAAQDWAQTARESQTGREASSQPSPWGATGGAETSLDVAQRAQAAQIATGPGSVQDRYNQNLRTTRGAWEADARGAATPADMYEARQQAANMTAAQEYARTKHRAELDTAIERADAELGQAQRTPDAYTRAIQSAQAQRAGEATWNMDQPLAQQVGRNLGLPEAAEQIGRGIQERNPGQVALGALTPVGNVFRGLHNIGQGVQGRIAHEGLGLNQGSPYQGPYADVAERVYREQGPAAYAAFVNEITQGDRPQIHPTPLDIYGQELPPEVANRPPQTVPSLQDIAMEATNPSNYLGTGLVGRGIRELGGLGAAGDVARINQAALEAGQAARTGHAAIAATHGFTPVASSLAAAERIAQNNAVRNLEPALSQNPSLQLGRQLGRAADIADTAINAPVTALNRGLGAAWNMGTVARDLPSVSAQLEVPRNSLARLSSQSQLSDEMAKQLDAARAARVAGEPTPLQIQASQTFTPSNRVPGNILAQHQSAIQQAATAGKWSQADLNVVNASVNQMGAATAKRVQDVQGLLDVIAKSPDPAVKAKAIQDMAIATGQVVTDYKTAQKAYNNFAAKEWNTYGKDVTSGITSYQAGSNQFGAPGTVAQQAALQLFSPNSLLTPTVRERLLRPANDPRTVAAFKEGVLDKQTAATALTNNDFKTLDKLLAKHSVTTPDQIDPMSHALGDYFKRVALDLGVPMNQQQSRAMQAVTWAYTNWKSAVLQTGGYPVQNALDIGFKSFTEGFWGYARGSTVDQFMTKVYGTPERFAELTRTLGGQGGQHDLMATGRLGEAFHEKLTSTNPITKWNPLSYTAATMQEVTGLIERSARDAAFLQAAEREYQRSLIGFEREFGRDLIQAGMNPQLARFTAGQLRGMPSQTPQAVRDGMLQSLTQRGATPQQAEAFATRAGQQWVLATERMAQQGLKLVERIHFNYGNRTNLETLGGLVNAVYPFTKWAMSNLKYYGEAIVSRPGLWTSLNMLDRMTENDPEAMANFLPPRLQGYINTQNLPGGNVISTILGSALWGDPRAVTYVNPGKMFVGARQQMNEGYTGRGASPLGTAEAALEGFTGMSLNPALQMLIQMSGHKGNVPVGSPLSARSAPGAALAAGYGALTGGRDVAQDINQVARAPWLERQYPSASGGGPLRDAALNKQVALDAMARGQNPRNAPDVRRSFDNPASPQYQQALAELNQQATAQPANILQGTLRPKGMPGGEYEQRQKDQQWQQAFQAAQTQGMDQAQAQAEAWRQVPDAFQLSPAGYGPTRNTAEARAQELGLTMPAGTQPRNQTPYPGPNASRETRDDYYQARARTNEAIGQQLNQGIDRFQQQQQALANLADQHTQRQQQLTQLGYGPWSDQWKQEQGWYGQERARIEGGWLQQQQQARPIAAQAGPRLPVEQVDRFNDLPVEAAWKIRQQHYFNLSETAGKAREAGDRLAFVGATRDNGPVPATDLIPDIMREYPGRWTPEQLQEQLRGIALPGYGDYLDRNHAYGDRLQNAVQQAFFAPFQGRSFDDPAVRRDYAIALQNNPLVAKVALSGSQDRRTGATRPAATLDEVQQAAAQLGVSVPALQVSPSGRVVTSPTATVEPYASADIYRNLSAPQYGGVTTGPVPPVGSQPAQLQPQAASTAPPTAVGATARAVSPSIARASTFQRTNEPFSGRTPQQQIGSAYNYAKQIEETQGKAAAAKYVYDNYDRFKALKDQLGEFMPSRGSYGRQALSEVRTRPGSFEGLTLNEGYKKMYAMRDMLDSARANQGFDRAVFANDWWSKFGEQLLPEHLTTQGIQDKFDWVVAQLQQAKRYEQTPAGAREIAQRDQVRNQFEQARVSRDQALADLKRANERYGAFGQKYQEIQATDRRAASKYYRDTTHEREQARAARDQAAAIYEKAKALADQSYEKAYGKRETSVNRPRDEDEAFNPAA